MFCAAGRTGFVVVVECSRDSLSSRSVLFVVAVVCAGGLSHVFAGVLFLAGRCRSVDVVVGGSLSVRRRKQAGSRAANTHLERDIATPPRRLGEEMDPLVLSATDAGFSK
jgi:hypothetical protein